MNAVNETLLDTQLAQLEKAANWSPRVISKLESFIRTADDYSVFRINPLDYAAERGISENEAIDLFLHASRIGLFDMEWNMLCACCAQVFASLKSIGKVHTHFVCNFCQMENHIELDDMIQVSFTLSSAVRDNIYRHPEKLSAEDYLFRYYPAKGVMREPNLGANEDYLKKFMLVLRYLEPGETVKLDLDITPGMVYSGDILHGSMVTFVAAPLPAGEAKTLPVHISFSSPEMKVSEPATAPLSLTIDTAHGEATYNMAHFAEVPAGRSQWVFENKTNERACISVFDAPPDITSTYVKVSSFLSGKRLLTSQTFRNLYRSEVIDANEGIGIRDITFLFTDLKGSTALYDQLGDLKAYHLVRQHFDALHNVIVKQSGAIVKTIGDAVMASFCTPLEGLKAALEIFRAIEDFNSTREEKLILKLGLHSGHSIAVTLNDRLDYFGQTVNIAARVQQQAEANEIYISKDVYSYKGVDKLLESCTVTPVEANVKGVSGKLQLYKITLNQMSGLR